MMKLLAIGHCRDAIEGLCCLRFESPHTVGTVRRGGYCFDEPNTESKMIGTCMVAAIETSLLTLEAGSVIALRAQVMMKGGGVAAQELERMWKEKALAWRTACLDLSTGSSLPEIHSDLRTIIRANFERLSEI